MRTKCVLAAESCASKARAPAHGSSNTHPAERDSLEAARIWLVEDVDHHGILILLAHSGYSSHELLIILRPQGRIIDCGGVLSQVIVNEDHEAVVDHLHGG